MKCIVIGDGAISIQRESRETSRWLVRTVSSSVCGHERCPVLGRKTKWRHKSWELKQKREPAQRRILGER